MGFDSMFTGVSGLNTYQDWIDMISNNIANVDTTGFKGQNMTFADLFYQQQGAPSGPSQNSGGVDPQDVGLGVKVGAIQTNWTNGGFATTGIGTDLAMNGDGFFILNGPNGGSPVYTRDGAFSLNSNGLLYDPSSGLTVQGYMANRAGQINRGALGNINIPIGLGMQATATGAGTKMGPAGDGVFDASIGGNLDQTQWSQQFLNQVGASQTAGQPYTISTTFYDSLGNAHPVQLTYSPDAAGATKATVGAPAGTVANITAGPTINQGAPPVNGAANATITITPNAAGTQATITDGLGNTQTVNAGAQVTMDGATFTLAGGPLAAGATTFNINFANNGLPSSVDNAQGKAVTPATRWQVTATFTDGTTFQSLSNGGSIAAGPPPVVTPPTTTTASTGVLGYVYCDQNGQFINSSSIETTAPGTSLTGPAVAAYLHGAGNQPGVNDGNELNIVSWGPGAGNNAQAPTGGGAPVTGPIGLDFSGIGSFGEANNSTGSTNNTNYTVSFTAQNGYPEGTLDNMTIGQDGTITGSFTNGQKQTLGQIALATFQNEDGLTRTGNNQYVPTAASGLAQIGIANSGRFGAIESGSLEQSNVSLSTEFTNLILAQRAFEANSRGITTADQNLQTITHLNASEN